MEIRFPTLLILRDMTRNTHPGKTRVVIEKAVKRAGAPILAYSLTYQKLIR
jgi:hypothetical protein